LLCVAPFLFFLIETKNMAAPPLDFSLGISWQFGALAVLSMLLFPFFRGRYAFLAGAAAYSLVDIVPSLMGYPTLGLWTLTGTLAWGLVALLFTLQKPNGSPITFAKLGIGGTLLFDAVTGVLATSLLYGVSFMDSLVGQIPFTFKHLLGFAALSILLAPFIFPVVQKRISSLKYFFLKPIPAVA
jgi:hypothetical protein